MGVGCLFSGLPLKAALTAAPPNLQVGGAAVDKTKSVRSETQGGVMPAGDVETLDAMKHRAEVQRIREQYGDDLQAGLLRLLAAIDES